MKRLLLVYILPLLPVVAGLLYVSGSAKWNAALFPVKPAPFTDAAISGTRYIPEPDGDPQFENYLLSTGTNYENIFLFGSSELSSSSDGIAYRFISKNFKTQVVAVGEAGSQCFSIYSQLLAKGNRLRDAPVVIILSPGWFEGKYAAGTAAPVYLKFISSAMLERIDADTSDECRRYVAQRVASYLPEINSPAAIHRKLYLDHRARRDPFSGAFCFPLRAGNAFIHQSPKQPAPGVYKRMPLVADSVSINWDSLLNSARTKSLAGITTNSIGINDDYYNHFVKGKTSEVHPVLRSRNTELDDFQELVKLLKARNVNASFIILPMHPHYYCNLREMKPVMDEITTTLADAKLPVYNMFTADTAAYDKALLTDVMHPGDYGWYTMSRFIIETYHLRK